jgi:hypothetical protein
MQDVSALTALVVMLLLAPSCSDAINKKMQLPVRGAEAKWFVSNVRNIHDRHIGDARMQVFSDVSNRNHLSKAQF